ncbi:MAG: hypothetical protein JXQ29_12480 [Planctomycetes bacterium]|nr:hypothetical protein [Planctomycetota bacterium]
MEDAIFLDFLKAQLVAGLALAAESDLLMLLPLRGSGPFPDRYLARFTCRGLVCDPETRAVAEHDRFEVGIHFPPDYLRAVRPYQIVTLLAPPHAWHPNLRFPGMCLGRMHPGTGIVELVYQAYEVITYQKMTTLEHDALNPEACAWARRNTARFPIDRRPLKRKPVAQFESLAADPTPEGGAP